MEIPALIDMMQDKEIIEVPEIRVWCHPEKIGEPGTDYFETFKSFKRALEFIKEHKEAEKTPLIAFRGYEINLFKIKTKKEIEEKEKKIVMEKEVKFKAEKTYVNEKGEFIEEGKIEIKEVEVKENEKNKTK